MSIKEFYKIRVDYVFCGLNDWELKGVDDVFYLFGIYDN